MSHVPLAWWSTMLPKLGAASTYCQKQVLNNSILDNTAPRTMNPANRAAHTDSNDRALVQLTLLITTV